MSFKEILPMLEPGATASGAFFTPPTSHRPAARTSSTSW